MKISTSAIFVWEINLQVSERACSIICWRPEDMWQQRKFQAEFVLDWKLFQEHFGLYLHDRRLMKLRNVLRTNW